MTWRLPPALTSAANRAAQSLDIRVGQVDVGHAQKRCDCLLRGVTEIGANDVGENIFACRLCRLGRIVYVAGPVLTVRDELLLAQDPKNRSNSGIGWRVREIAHDLGDGGARAAVEDVHHLALASGKGSGCRFGFRHQRGSHGNRLNGSRTPGPYW